MTQQFTASEVRELAATIWPDLSGREEVSETLNAFADLLEAQERAVPVVTRESAINAIEHVGRYNGPGRETEARQMLVEGSPSAAHHAQAQPPAARVPDAMPKVPVNADEVESGYLRSLEDACWNAGWNACRDAIFAAQENPNG